MTKDIHKKIYSTIATLLDYETMPRTSLIDKAYRQLTHKRSATSTHAVGEATILRGNVGAVLDELIEHGLVDFNDDGYFLVSKKPIVLRTEACEREVLKLLRESPMQKVDLRKRLESYFGTDGTISKKDDNILHSLIGKVLGRLTKLGIICLSDGYYSIAKDKAAKLDDIDELLAVKVDFLSRLHAKGGEFFEHFFMTLLGEYLSIHGKKIESNEVKGGTQDGGIDGVITTVDALGFRETIMVQMKNRLEDTTETTVRGFWGSVCAYQGTRGIFATTSGFHQSAEAFLNAIDNCVGIDGDRIFLMACECCYGIKKRNGKYSVDTKLL